MIRERKREAVEGVGGGRVGGRASDSSSTEEEYAPSGRCRWALGDPGARKVRVRGEEEEQVPEEDSDARRQIAERERGNDGEKKGGMPLESAKRSVGDEIVDRKANSEERVLSAGSE